MDQSWRRARLRAIRRQLFGASTFHRDSDAHTIHPSATVTPARPRALRGYVQTIQVSAVFTLRSVMVHVSSVKRGLRALALALARSLARALRSAELAV